MTILDQLGTGASRTGTTLADIDFRRRTSVIEAEAEDLQSFD